MERRGRDFPVCPIRTTGRIGIGLRSSITSITGGGTTAHRVLSSPRGVGTSWLRRRRHMKRIGKERREEENWKALTGAKNDLNEAKSARKRRKQREKCEKQGFSTS